MEENQLGMSINDEEIVEYIFNKLIHEGIVVKREDILKILDYEMQFMVDNGIAEIIPLDESE